MDQAGKAWDRPWTTDEMRRRRDDWSLAADAGLLKHLEQFSDNLTERFKKTEEKLRSLSSELEEACVVIDNVTNASLALANTQFIESRVNEDDSEMDKSDDARLSKDEKRDVYREDLIARASESIGEGLNIMNEKFERQEILASDSEDEADIPVPSVVLKPKDPYKNRPLPYVIGTDKWKSSKKGGLETSSSSSSSSDSEAADGEEDSASSSPIRVEDNASTVSNNRRDSPSRRSLSSPSGSSARNERSAAAAAAAAAKDDSSSNDKPEKTHSRDRLNSGSEMTRAKVARPRAQDTSRETPSFAEELAKRLGSVLPINKTVEPLNNREADESSINRWKDDLLAPDAKDVFDTKTDDIFTDDENLFDERVSDSLWKNQAYKPPITNVIPPSFDVPPPMHTRATKQKSAFDDLCADSELEDSDDIFAPKRTKKRLPSDSKTMSDDKRESSNDSREKKNFNVLVGDIASNMATSTPEINDNGGGLFGDENHYENENENEDEEEDDDDVLLFGTLIKSNSRINQRSPELARAATSATMPPELSIIQADILSSNVGSRLFQGGARQDWSDSSDNAESSMNNSNGPGNERIVPESDSSGISIRPSNDTTDNTFGLGGDFEPQSESTRLKSEEIYRERFASDSLFEGRTRQPEESTDSILRGDEAAAAAAAAAPRIMVDYLDSPRNEDFDMEDVFGPPPLPKRNDSESKSNEDLFSNSSCESRSRKSLDLSIAAAAAAAATSESRYDVKVASEGGGDGDGRGLFDEDVDLFGDGDAPQIDIFGRALESPNFSLKDCTARGISKIASTGNNEDGSYRGMNDTAKIRLPAETRRRRRRSIFEVSEEESDAADDDLFASGSFVKKCGKRGAGGKKVDEATSKTNAIGSRTLGENKQQRRDDKVLSDVAIERERGDENLSESDESRREDVSSGNIGETTVGRDAPKCPSIRLPIVEDDSWGPLTAKIIPPRRPLSGKIKNLIGKMGDLKILSPTDTPPLWRKSEDKVDSDCEKMESGDSEDGGSFGVQAAATTTTTTETLAGSPPGGDSPNSETPLSFDLPARLQVLPLAASKSRARIQVKRRPQSRHARRSALRNSAAIDFDDTVDDLASENTLSGISDKTRVATAAVFGKDGDDDSEARKDNETDKTIGKKRLLSPSTDEEDLWDVPPDLPEDPTNEDHDSVSFGLFGRAPILSPIDPSYPISKDSADMPDSRASTSDVGNNRIDDEGSTSTSTSTRRTTEALDPLRDDHHDPLRDPSQLFAFVTKTPSPEKGRRDVEFEEDASLFADSSKRTNREGKSAASERAPISDLFDDDDDSSGDLFSGGLATSTTRSIQSTKNKSLFVKDDDTEEEEEEEEEAASDLFGNGSTCARDKSMRKDERRRRRIEEGRGGRGASPISIFADEDDTSLFPPLTSKISKDTRNNGDLFGDRSSPEEDLFAANTRLGSAKISSANTGGSLFSDLTDDADDIFRRKNPSKTSDSETMENRRSVKKALTRDLKKTAETIVQDPLSMLQDE